MDMLECLDILLGKESVTLEGAAKRLKGEKKDIISKARVLETLKGIRKQLEEIRKDL